MRVEKPTSKPFWLWKPLYPIGGVHKIIPVLGLVMALLLPLNSFGASSVSQTASTPHRAATVLNARVDHVQNHAIPKNLYGLWKRVRHIEETNGPREHLASEGMWSITRVDDRLYLMNPATGAQAEMHLKHANHNHVSFEIERLRSSGRMCREQLDITIDGRHITGTQAIRCTPSQRSATGHSQGGDYYAKATVEGWKADNTLLPLSLSPGS